MLVGARLLLLTSDPAAGSLMIWRSWRSTNVPTCGGGGATARKQEAAARRWTTFPQYKRKQGDWGFFVSTNDLTVDAV